MPEHLFEDDVFLNSIFNAIPFPTLVVDDDVRILYLEFCCSSSA